MIQKSGPNLQLVVQPKEHDVLQQVKINLIKSHFHKLIKIKIILNVSVLLIRHIILIRT